MATKRQEVTDFMVGHVNKIIPGYTTSGDLLRTELDALTDAQFAEFVEGLKPRAVVKDKEARTVIPFYLPNLSEKKVSIARCFKLTRDLGRSLSQRLVMTDPHTGVEYLTPHEYPCLDIAVRRQAQTGFKKRSIPDATQQIDDMSGQPTAMAKGSRISSPESKFLDSRDLLASQSELTHVRGGSQKAYREFRRTLATVGEADLKDFRGLGSAKSTEVVSAFLNAQHLGNNIVAGTTVPQDALPDKLKEKS